MERAGCLVLLLLKTRPSRGRGCIFVAFILFFLLSPCPHTWSLSVLTNVRSHQTHAHCPSFSRLPVCHTHTNTRTQSQVHWVWTPIVSVFCVAHPPFAISPSPFQSSPLGKLIIFTPHSLDWPLLELLSL